MPIIGPDKNLVVGYGDPLPQRAGEHNNFWAHRPSRFGAHWLAPTLAELLGSEAADAVESEAEDHAVFFS